MGEGHTLIKSYQLHSRKGSEILSQQKKSLGLILKLPLTANPVTFKKNLYNTYYIQQSPALRSSVTTKRQTLFFLTYFRGSAVWNLFCRDTSAVGVKSYVKIKQALVHMCERTITTRFSTFTLKCVQSWGVTFSYSPRCGEGGRGGGGGGGGAEGSTGLREGE